MKNSVTAAKYGKFSTLAELVKGYEHLQAAFTKKCQLYAQLEKQLKKHENESGAQADQLLEQVVRFGAGLAEDDEHYSGEKAESDSNADSTDVAKERVDSARVESADVDIEGIDGASASVELANGDSADDKSTDVDIDGTDDDSADVYIDGANVDIEGNVNGKNAELVNAHDRKVALISILEGNAACGNADEANNAEYEKTCANADANDANSDNSANCTEQKDNNTRQSTHLCGNSANCTEQKQNPINGNAHADKTYAQDEKTIQTPHNTPLGTSVKPPKSNGATLPNAHFSAETACNCASTNEATETSTLANPYLALANDDQFIRDYVLTNPKAVAAVLDDYLARIRRTPLVTVGGGSNYVALPPKQPRNLQEARKLAEKLL